MPETKRARELLTTAGLRPTAQRLAVLELVTGRARPATAQEIHHELRRKGAAPGLTTVYRTLTALAEAQVLDTFDRHGEQCFRLCGRDHHHHLVCVRCGSVEEVDGDEVETWVKRTARRRGFRVDSHRADVYGECRTCR
jgi:Fur family ferric uptake transcriptional regulator